MVFVWYISNMIETKVSKLNIPPQVFKFTESSVLKKTLMRAKAYLCTDSEDNSFKIKVYSTGRRVYRTHARIKGGESIPVTHGVVGQLKLKDARSMHQSALAVMRQGINPNNVIQEEEIPSIRASIEDYIQYNKELADSTKSLYKGLLANHLTHKMFNRPFEELKEEPFKKWHKSFEGDKEAIAINCLKLLSSTFNAQPKSIRNNSENPRDIIKRNKGLFKQQTKVDVYLDPEWNHKAGTNEVERFLELLMDVHLGWDEPISEHDDQYIPPTQDQVYIDATLMLLLTAVRVDALINLTWKDVNFKKGVFIVQEKGTRGKKKTRVVPLTKYTYRCLRFRQERNRPKKSQWVFPSMRLRRKDGKYNGRDLKGKQHIDNPKHIFKKMKRRAKRWTEGYETAVMEKIDRHGLRRTLANIAKHLGYDMQTLSSVLDQSNSGVTSNNYVGGAISEKALKECYESCHNFIDNRLRAVIGFQVKEEKDDKKAYSPLLYLWGKPKEELELDEYSSVEYQASVFDEETTAFPDMD